MSVINKILLATLAVLTFAGTLALGVAFLGWLWIATLLTAVTNAPPFPKLPIVLAGLGAIALGAVSLFATNTLKRRFNLKAPAALIILLLIVSVPASAQVAYIRKKVGNRVVVLAVKRETAERLKRHHATEADRKELKAAWNVALGVTRTQHVSCITGTPELPHADVERWLRCPVQNIGMRR